MLTAGFRNNDQGCLSNTVLQACARQRIQVAHAVGPEMRKIIEEDGVPLDQVDQVLLRQTPKRGGFVEFTLGVYTRSADGGVMRERTFQGSSLTATPQIFTLYDKAVDGKVSFLHLTH